MAVIKQAVSRLASAPTDVKERLGTLGYLAAFVWLLVIGMATPAERLPWVTLVCLGLAFWTFRRPAGSRSRGSSRLLPARLVLLVLLMVAPPIFVLGEADRALFGVHYSSEGLWIAATIALRMVIVFSAVQGMTAAVDSTALAGVMERAGLHGLGFAVGVALNMLPCLQETGTTMWQALRMRGGLRHQWLQGIRLLTISVLCHALMRAEEIAIAAEARAFSPERSRPMPIRAGRYDRLVAVCGALLLALALLPWPVLP